LETIYNLLVYMPALVLTLVLMSMARAYVADMLGDPTPRHLGLLTLNPTRHVDPVGTLAIPAMLALVGAPVFGWGKGFMLDGDNYRHPRADAAVVAIVGPAVALLAAAIAAALIGFSYDLVSGSSSGPLIEYCFRFLVALLGTGCLLALFNLLPIPGLDGGKVVEALLPRETAVKFASLSQYSLLILVALIVVMPMLSPQMDIIRQLLLPIANAISGTLLWAAGVPL